MKLLIVIKFVNQDWWKVESGGRQGFVPANYVQMVDTPAETSASPRTDAEQDLVQLKQTTIERKSVLTLSLPLLQNPSSLSHCSGTPTSSCWPKSGRRGLRSLSNGLH